MIGGASSILLIRRIFSIFNAKYLYIVFTVFFIASSTLYGGAPSINTFIIGRIIVELGRNGICIDVFILLSVNVTDKERPAYLGLTYIRLYYFLSCTVC